MAEVKTRKKLIEVALPLPEINDASAYDKMPGIGPHPKGIHHWWARLPLPTARAVLFASVVDDPAGHPERWTTEVAQSAERERLFDIIRAMMGKKLHEHPEIYLRAHTEMLQHCNGTLPPVFDPFAGGGSIPLEANRLGFKTHATDLNPVAVLLNKCNLELAPRWAGCPPVNPRDREGIAGREAWSGTRGLSADVRHYGQIIGEQVQSKVGHLYPKVQLPKAYGGGNASVVAWIWTRTVASPNPAARGRHVPLASTYMLSTKSDQQAWIEAILDPSAVDGWRPVVHLLTPPAEKAARAKLGAKAGKAQAFICLLTGTPIPREYVQAEGKAGRLGMRLLATVVTTNRSKLFLSATTDQETIGRSPDIAAEEARESFLSGPLPTRAEITGGVCTAYGLNSWGHLFHTRQLTALLALSDSVRAVAAAVRQDALSAGYSSDDASKYATVVATFLALAVDRCADFNNVLCRWSPSNQKVMNLFGKQALPMVFDFAEANVLGDAVGAWKTCSEYVADCIEVLIAGSPRLGHASQKDAATEIGELRNLLVSTDPPYYNNISYATLSDFFYVWLRRAIGGLHPELFGTLLTPKQDELIAAADRFGGSSDAAKEHFEDGFREAFRTLREGSDPTFPMTVYYAYKQDDEQGDSHADGGASSALDLTTGWETLLEALIGSGFQITATWPVRASQKWRMVSMGTNALASYIVLACRPRPVDIGQTDRRSFIAELKRELPPALRRLQQGNIAPVDFAQAAIGPGMAIYSKYGGILERDGNAMTVRTALYLINQTLTQVLSEHDDEFDAETRWAVAWFEQFGFEEGEYGTAETLSKAKNTSVSGMVDAGIVKSGRSKVRLLKPAELSAEWDLDSDSRFTAWETVHRLIRALDDGGESGAAAVVARLGTKAGIARELAYGLYTLCERSKRAAEALPYNSLVQSWSEITRLAQQSRGSEPQQAPLF